MSFMCPLLSFQRSLTARLPHVPLVRFAKKRNVGRVMSTHGGSVPWWRVVRADGSLPPSHDEEARAHYREEGTPLKRSGRMDMEQAYFGDFGA